VALDILPLNVIEILFIALVIDAIIGEPKFIWDRIPHPAVLMGRSIGWCDTTFNSGGARFLKGSLVMLVLILLAYGIGTLLVMIPSNNIIDIAIVTIMLAQKSLVDHVKAVAIALEGGTAEGRIAVAKIVGRDTSDMDESSISRAAIESAAENFSDGIIAPAFWFLAFGVPGMLVYKLVNTADSMIGYLNDRYAYFGKFAARLDDAMNWIPARITGALFCMVGRKSGAWEVMREDAGFHRSPNAGWPEAAMAASLNVALAGPRSYEGKLTRDIFINGSARRELTRTDIRRSVGILWRAWSALLFVLALCAIILAIA